MQGPAGAFQPLFLSSCGSLPCCCFPCFPPPPVLVAPCNPLCLSVCQVQQFVSRAFHFLPSPNAQHCARASFVSSKHLLVNRLPQTPPSVPALLRCTRASDVEYKYFIRHVLQPLAPFPCAS